MKVSVVPHPYLTLSILNALVLSIAQSKDTGKLSDNKQGTKFKASPTAYGQFRTVARRDDFTRYLEHEAHVLCSQPISSTTSTRQEWDKTNPNHILLAENIKALLLGLLDRTVLVTPKRQVCEHLWGQTYPGILSWECEKVPNIPTCWKEKGETDTNIVSLLL